MKWVPWWRVPIQSTASRLVETRKWTNILTVFKCYDACQSTFKVDDSDGLLSRVCIWGIIVVGIDASSKGNPPAPSRWASLSLHLRPLWLWRTAPFAVGGLRPPLLSLFGPDSPFVYGRRSEKSPRDGVEATCTRNRALSLRIIPSSGGTDRIEPSPDHPHIPRALKVFEATSWISIPLFDHLQWKRQEGSPTYLEKFLPSVLSVAYAMSGRVANAVSGRLL